MADKEILDAILAELKGLKTTVSEIKTKQEEDYLILKALEQNLNVNKVEHNKMDDTSLHIHGNLKNINENIGAVKEILGHHEFDFQVLKRLMINRQ